VADWPMKPWASHMAKTCSPTRSSATRTMTPASRPTVWRVRGFVVVIAWDRGGRRRHHARGCGANIFGDGAEDIFVTRWTPTPNLMPPSSAGEQASSRRQFGGSRQANVELIAAHHRRARK
jgi:hypothetical protein